MAFDVLICIVLSHYLLNWFKRAKMHRVAKKGRWARTHRPPFCAERVTKECLLRCSLQRASTKRANVATGLLRARNNIRRDVVTKCILRNRRNSHGISELASAAVKSGRPTVTRGRYVRRCERLTLPCRQRAVAVHGNIGPGA